METVAADLGIMWIVTECGKRKILYLRDNDARPQIDDATHQSHHDATVCRVEKREHLTGPAEIHQNGPFQEKQPTATTS